MAKLISLNTSEWTKEFDNIIPEKGICIFIDIVGSTTLKYLPFKQWLAFLHNNIVQAISSFFHFCTFYKVIGDCVMIWINENNMTRAGENELTIFNFLLNIAKESDSQYFKDVKVSVCYCTSVFEITFIPDLEDAYGQEIDLCSRLNSLANEKQILMNEPFYLKLLNQFHQTGNKIQFSDVLKIQGPNRKKIKGFKKMEKIYKFL